MTEVVIGEAALFGSKQQRHTGRNLRSNPRDRIRQRNRLVLELPVSPGCCPDDQRAIRYGLSNARTFTRIRQQIGSAHGRFCLSERRAVRIHETKARESKIAHGARRGANVQRIPRGHQHHGYTVEKC